MTTPDTKQTEADGGPVIFVNQPEITDGWTVEETADFRSFLARMAPVWAAMDLPTPAGETTTEGTDR